jgi:hypothetical protein
MLQAFGEGTCRMDQKIAGKARTPQDGLGPAQKAAPESHSWWSMAPVSPRDSRNIGWVS